MVLESKRAKLEELEAIESAISARFKRNPSLFPGSTAKIEKESGTILASKNRPWKEIVIQRHEIASFLARFGKLQTEVLSLDVKNEISALKTGDFSDFDKKFDELAKSLGSESSAPVTLAHIYAMGGASDETQTILSKFAAELDVDKVFTIEENYGKCLDLVTFHETWLNLKGVKDRLSYLKYLDVFYQVGEGKNSLDRTSKEYSDYVRELAQYLKSFFVKTRILQSPQTTISRIMSEYSSNGSNGDSQSLFCAACNKTFAKDTVYKAHLSGKKHVKNASKSSNSDPSLDEYLIRSFASLLEKEILQTKDNVERRQGLTMKERQEEMRERLATIGDYNFPVDLDDQDESDLDSDSETPSIPNPLNLPLDVDGKPMPYWLWKLQGLNKQFECEICGNFAYSGRKIFESHFSEERHIYGLKCLGITFDKSESGTQMLFAFKGITKIEEASDFWKKLKKKMAKSGAIVDLENVEEVEDEEGNIMTKKVYEDLKKQGLL